MTIFQRRQKNKQVATAPQRFKHHQNSTKRPPERKKKREILGRPTLSGPHPSGPHPSGQVWPKSANFRLAKVGLAQSRSIKVGQNRSRFFWPKSVVAKVGFGQSQPIRMAKVGLAKVGSQPKNGPGRPFWVVFPKGTFHRLFFGFFRCAGGVWVIAAGDRSLPSTTTLPTNTTTIL